MKDKWLLVKLPLFLFVALLAFAANSVLCRNALANGTIDPASFTFIRLVSGALTLLVICFWQHRDMFNLHQHGSWLGSSMLGAYALGFSYAYIHLGTGMGALILFSAVQFTILGIHFFKGTRYSTLEYVGAAISFIGFIILVRPQQAQAPAAWSIVIMAIAGIAWGIYTLVGSVSRSPLEDTASNFLRCLPMISVVFLLTVSKHHITSEGMWLAVFSGSVASGIGYAIWYRVLPHISGMLSALSQLIVPLLAGAGGLYFSNESMTASFVIASVLILGGIALVLVNTKS